jgi:hypothetical protein
MASDLLLMTYESVDAKALGEHRFSSTCFAYANADKLPKLQFEISPRNAPA